MMGVRKLKRLAILFGYLGLTSPVMAACDFSTHLFRDALSNPAEIQHIGVEIAKSRKWFKNSISILTSHELNIDDKYKDKLGAIVSVRYSFGTCKYKARVRQSGDWKDHIELLSGGNVVSSLDVKLLEGNVLNAVRFKLLLPPSRNGINEVLGTLLLRELDYIAPETFMVPADINGVKHTFLFQENAAKELLERNLRREGPIFEGDESVLWNVDGFKPFELEGISLARLGNGSWAAKGETSTKMALSAFEKLQTSYIAYAAAGGSGGLRLVPNTEADNQEFETFAVLMAAMNGTHTLRPHNRKFYFNSFSQTFEPIYYDGNLDLTNEVVKARETVAAPDVEFFLSHASPSALLEIAQQIEVLQKDGDFRDGFTRRSGLKADEAEAFFQKSMTAVLRNLASLRDEQSAQTSVSAPKFPTNIDELKARIIEQTAVSGLETTFAELDEFAENSKASKLPTSETGAGGTFKISREELIDVMTDNAYGDDRLVLLPKESKAADQRFSVMPFLGGEILISTGASIDMNAEARVLKIAQTAPTDWVMIRNAKVEDWTISFEGAAQDARLVSAQRFNEFGLTGCVNFYDVDFTDAHLLGRDGQCEDTINIVASRGTLAELVVEDGFADAIDIDFAQVSIETLRVINTGNDCFDVSTGVFDITTAHLSGCADKGLSVGENSVLMAADVTISGAAIGVSSKDFSDVKIANFSGDQIAICAEAFQKKQEFGGGQLTIDQYVCSGDIQQDKASGIALNGLTQ